jgi:hypothetical protein
MALSSKPVAPRPAVDPLFAGPVSEPPVGFTRAVSSSSSSFRASPLSKLAAHKTIAMIAAAAILFIVVGTIGISAVFSDSGEAKRAASWVHLPPPKVANASEAAPAPSASDSDDSVSTPDNKHGKRGKARHGGGAGMSSKHVITSKTPYVAPAPPPKPTDTCGCHGDFNCIIRCSAKGK